MTLDQVTSPLSPLFAPRGIAVVGASSDPNKMGSVMGQALAAFSGRVVLVNERGADPIHALHSSVSDGAAGAPIDLAILCVPAALCAGALERAALGGVRSALVCAGGFGESGPAGETAQKALLDAARRHNVRLLGPNTSGFIAPGRDLFATFIPGARTLKSGRVGVVAASGGVNHALAFLLDRAGYGISLAVGLGNAIDVYTADVVDHLADDAETRAIAIHIESVPDGDRLLDAVRRASGIKPVVALVVGKAEVGDFARSHTGALATAWRTTRAVLAQAGAVLVDDERHLVDAVGTLSLTRLAPIQDPGTALVTAQAGPGLLVMDDLRDHGVRLPQLAANTQAAIAGHLPPITYQANPVDTGRPGASFSSVLEIVGTDPDVDLIAVYALAEPGAVDLADAIETAVGTTPLVAAVGGIDAEMLPIRRQLFNAGISAATDPTGLANGVRALVSDSRRQYRQRNEGPVPALPDAARLRIATTDEWTEAAAKTLLDSLGILTPRREVCDSDEQVRKAFATLSSPVAIKLLDADVLHKTEIGGVHLGVANEAQLDGALAALRAAGARKFLVEEMAPSGVDLLVGARRDPVFGPVVLVGLGGTVAEALADVALRAAPLPLSEAAEMPSDLLGSATLDGWRGGPQLDYQELAHVLSLLGTVLVEHPGLAEIEINPLRLTDRGLIALDAVILRSSHATPDE